MTPQNMTTGTETHTLTRFSNNNQSQTNVENATKTDRKTNAKGDQTPTRTDVMSTETRLIDNRISDRMSTEKI